jgi:PhnB protein
MKPNLLFDFSVNKEENTIKVKREFAADLPLVWDAWTNPELLDQWFAPKPFRTKTKSMDFREGGVWLYAMISPENIPHWCRTGYKKIEVRKSFSGSDAFSDEHGNINTEFPTSQFSNEFHGDDDSTTVSITLVYQSLSDLEKSIQMGFKEGFTKSLENLDQYLEAQFKLRGEYKKDNTTRVCTYLNFPGNTEEAFLFYKSVFKTRFAGDGIRRFGDIPADESHPPVAEAVKKMVLHVELPITGNHVLMGTDAPKEMGFTLVQGNNMHISVEPETREEAKRIFDQLSDGGTIDMPLEDMFFGAYFGSFTDKYGINWMINFQTKSDK